MVSQFCQWVVHFKDKFIKNIRRNVSLCRKFLLPKKTGVHERNSLIPRTVSSTQLYVLGANTVNGCVVSSTGNHMTLSERLKPLFLVITSCRELSALHYEGSGNEHYPTAHSHSAFSSSPTFSIMFCTHFIFLM